MTAVEQAEQAHWRARARARALLQRSPEQRREGGSSYGEWRTLRTLHRICVLCRQHWQAGTSHRLSSRAAFTTFNLHPARAGRQVARRSVESCTTFGVQRPRLTRVGAPPRIPCMIDGLRAERRVSTCLRGSLTAALLRRSGEMKGSLAQRSSVWSGRLSRKRRSPARTAPWPSARRRSRSAARLPWQPGRHNCRFTGEWVKAQLGAWRAEQL